MICGNWICGNEFQLKKEKDPQPLHFKVLAGIDQVIKDQVQPQEVQGHQKAVIRVITSNYTQLMKNINQSQDHKFTDPEFPPHYESLGDFKGKQRKIDWMRITDLFTNPVLFEKSIQPADIVQGNSEDCYFLSSLASLAQKPGYIRQIFSRCSIKEGIYSIWIKLRGVPTEVVVDQYLPVYKGGLIFSKPRTGTEEVWVLILEKAWAKVHGSYQAITGGYPINVLNSFCTGPSFHYSISGQGLSALPLKRLQEMIIRRLEYANTKGFPICAGSKNGDHITKHGLIQTHAYSLISIQKLNVLKGQHLVCLRNPWGEYQWTGEFSDKDPIWKEVSQEEKKRIHYKNKDNGFFFMPLHKFMLYFESMDICHILNGFNYHFQPFSIKSQKSAFFKITLDHASKMYFMLHFDNPDSTKKAVLLLARMEDPQFDYIGSASEMVFNCCNVSTHDEWSAGEYLVYVKIQYKEQQLMQHKQYKDQAITLSAYSNTLPRIIQLQKKTFKKTYPNFFKQIFVERARKRRKVIVDEPLLCYSQEFLLQKGDFGYFIAESDERSQKNLAIIFDEKDFSRQGLRLKKPYKNIVGRQEIRVLPGERQVITCRLKGIAQQLKFPPLTIKESI